MHRDRQETPQLSIARTLAQMVQDGMTAVMQTTATVERDYGVNRVRLELQGARKTWYLNGEETDIRTIVQVITNAPQLRVLGTQLGKGD